MEQKHKDRWTEQEIDFLRNNFIEKINRSKSSIGHKKSRLGLHKNHVWTNKDINILKKEFPKSDLKKLAVKLNSTVQNKIKRNVKFNLAESNGQWKGNKVGRNSLHRWIETRKPKPDFCEKCKEKEPYDLANISQQYKRDINDFQWLCRSCHMFSDGRFFNLKNHGGLTLS